MANRFQITSLDPEEMKQSLIDFMKSKPEFADFDYEGSAINTIIDLLVRNAHLTSYEANMLANESFLQSSQIRGNASAHSQKLSYLPRSRTAARITCDIELEPDDNPPQNTITAPAGLSFIRSIGGITYTFTNPQSFTLFENGLGNYIANNIELVQGQFISNQYVYDNTTSQKLFIPNRNVDTSTIRVFIKSSPTASFREEYVRVEDISDVSVDSSVFYLGETRNEEYFIEFGRDVLGNEPENGSIVMIEYVVTEDDHGNKIDSLIAGSTIQGYSNITVDVITPSFGGADKSTLEEIKFIAPRAYQSQNRAVRESDYVVELKKRYPFIKAANVWGGEKNDPPYFGRVFISLITDGNVILTDTLKRDIEESLNSSNVVTITPVLVDTSFIDISIDVEITFNKNVTKKTFNELSSIVSDVIDAYADDLLNFESYYNNSELIDRIHAADRSIESVEINKTVSNEIESKPNNNVQYSINFKNEIEKDSVLITNFTTDVTASKEIIYDNGDGILVRERTNGGNVTTSNVGSVDYDKGEIEFSITNIDSEDINVQMTPRKSNFYSNLQNVLRLNTNSITEFVRET